jgi:hypothetical protein
MAIAKSGHVTLRERSSATEGSLSGVTEILRTPEEHRGAKKTCQGEKY